MGFFKVALGLKLNKGLRIQPVLLLAPKSSNLFRKVWIFQFLVVKEHSYAISPGLMAECMFKRDRLLQRQT
jgi:hypothetical protein